MLFILDFMYGIGTEGYPTLGAWKDAMVSRPGVAGYLADAEPVLYEAVKMRVFICDTAVIKQTLHSVLDTPYKN